jgi:predicted hotdog family 3-hydroxylacyl-ACP dehydratase
MNDMPAIDEVIVHDAPMILIDNLVKVVKNHVHCQVTIHDSGLFFDQETRTVPGYVGIEFMAQTVAAWAGFHAREQGEKPPVGFLLGGRSYQCESPAFSEGAELDIHAEQIMKSENMAVFSCTIQHKGVMQAKCELNVFQPPPETQAELNSSAKIN